MYTPTLTRARTFSAKRISNREMRRRAQAAIEHGTKTHLILLAVLAQSGGEVTVTDGTLQQVGMNLATLDFAILAGKQKGESIVRLVDGKETAPSTPEPVIDNHKDTDVA
jgi:hypothetical protein